MKICFCNEGEEIKMFSDKGKVRGFVIANLL